MNPKVKNILEWVYCIVIAVVLALLFRYFIGTPTIVKQISMYPTLEQNQRLWLNRWGRTTKTLPKRGEIITFEEPSKVSYNENEINQENPVAQFEQRTGWNWFVNNFLEMGKKRSYIKRVIALPGEHVKIENGKVYINGYFHCNSPSVGITTCFFVPEGFRPKIKCGSACYTDDDVNFNNIGAVKIDTNGDITIYFPTVYSTCVYTSIVYDID